MINFFKRIGDFFSAGFNWVRRNWRLTSAIILIIAAALTVGLLVAFFPPVLAFIAGISLFGVAPFVALSSMSLIAASFASAGIAAATMFALTALFNVVYSCTKWLDQKITPATDEASDTKPDDTNEEDYLFHSNTTMRQGLAQGTSTATEQTLSSNAHDYDGGQQYEPLYSKKTDMTLSTGSLSVSALAMI